jgi:carbamoyl-phosphate synthase small subunit
MPTELSQRQSVGADRGSDKSAMLVLEDGRCFRGEPFGAEGETFGEAVFSTGMSGYQETLTDPSYYRQVVVMTAPHVGNTGMNDEDPESRRIWVSGYVVRDPARVPSSWRAARTLDDELRDQGVVGISGIDTRALTRHLRERGAMRVGISTTEDDPAALLERVLASSEMTGADLAGQVSTSQTYVVPAVGEQRFTVVALDLGIKANTPRMLAARGIEVHVMPALSTLEDVLAVGADAVFFSNGPGDPAATAHQVELLRGLLERRVPYFGICFGNQLFGRALGLDTYKLKYGHRGINQPVMDRTTGRVEVTAHNHGFAVRWPDGLTIDEPVDTPYGRATVSHVCLNDDVVEGLELRDGSGALTAFSVQYHPEAAAGPHDAAYLFDRFADLMAVAGGPAAGPPEGGRPGIHPSLAGSLRGPVPSTPGRPPSSGPASGAAAPPGSPTGAATRAATGAASGAASGAETGEDA